MTIGELFFGIVISVLAYWFAAGTLFETILLRIPYKKKNKDPVNDKTEMQDWDTRFAEFSRFRIQSSEHTQEQLQNAFGDRYTPEQLQNAVNDNHKVQKS